MSTIQFQSLVQHDATTTALIVVLTVLSCYSFYQRFFHPLSKYPGPFVASLTNFWKVYHTYQLQLHEKLVELHEQYGPVVRIGPNDLHFNGAAAISMYKAGRSLGKTPFYDAFTTFNPNLFGTQDEDIHALRRRQLAHGFSQSSIQNLEYFIDKQLKIFCDKLEGFAKNEEVIDLKDHISRYVLDVLGEIAFSRSFEAQTTSQADEVHDAINDHILLACMIGQLSGQAFWKRLAAWSPVPWMRRLLKSRAILKNRCADSVAHRLQHPSDRKDLLKSLIDAKDPETGAELTELDINTEAFAMLVAGSHTTAGTLGLLFWHLTTHPSTLARATAELDAHLSGPPAAPLPLAGLEAALPYTMACIRENFRLNPVFTMCLWRRVHPPEGVEVDGHWIPHGTNIALSNHALHHNARLWGASHAAFDPSRWLDGGSAQGLEGLLLPFSTGHRVCIGRNLAMTNVVKTAATLVGMFAFETVEGGGEGRFRSSGIGELEGPLLVRVKRRRGKEG